MRIRVTLNSPPRATTASTYGQRSVVTRTSTPAAARGTGDGSCREEVLLAPDRSFYLTRLALPSMQTDGEVEHVGSGVSEIADDVAARCCGIIRGVDPVVGVPVTTQTERADRADPFDAGRDRPGPARGSDG